MGGEQSLSSFPPFPPLAGLLRAVEILGRLEIPYVIGGSMASAARGEPRSTQDADLLIDLPPAKAEDLSAALAPDFHLAPSAARDAAARHDSFSAIHEATADKIDFFILDPLDPLGRGQMDRRSLCRVGDSELFMSSAEDIVLRKLDWHRRSAGMSDRQWRDILGVLKLQRSGLDLVYLKKQAEIAGLSEPLGRALAAAGI